MSVAAERDPGRYLVEGGVLIPPGSLAGDLERVLLVALRDRVRAGGGGLVSPGVVAVVEALHAASLVSEFGPAAAGFGTVEGVEQWVTPDDAGQAVGASGRHVRRLCADGLVRHRLVGARRYLVDVEDLRRHLRGEAA